MQDDGVKSKHKPFFCSCLQFQFTFIQKPGPQCLTVHLQVALTILSVWQGVGALEAAHVPIYYTEGNRGCGVREARESVS